MKSFSRRRRPYATEIERGRPGPRQCMNERATHTHTHIHTFISFYAFLYTRCFRGSALQQRQLVCDGGRRPFFLFACNCERAAFALCLCVGVCDMTWGGRRSPLLSFLHSCAVYAHIFHRS